MISKGNQKMNFVSVEIIDDSSDEEIKDEIEMDNSLKEEIKIKCDEQLTRDKVTTKVTKRVTKKAQPSKDTDVIIQKDNNEKSKDEKKEKKKLEGKNEKEKPLIEPICLLKKFYYSEGILEIGADEAGRGPMFGRVYSGAVILPKDDSFDHFKMKDSKKFTSKNLKKINEVAEYIKQHAIAWAVEYEDEVVIDEINILQATQSAMHKAIKNVIAQLQKNLNIQLENNMDNLLLLIDGNYFKQLTILNKTKTKLVNVKYEMIEGGDNKYTSIAAASILAKVERDKYIEDLCRENPELIEHYGIDSNKGYGSKRHMDGIRKYGITKWHRRTFGICSTFSKVEPNNN
jgi:ribonuclease HII